MSPGCGPWQWNWLQVYVGLLGTGGTTAPVVGLPKDKTSLDYGKEAGNGPPSDQSSLTGTQFLSSRSVWASSWRHTTYRQMLACTCVVTIMWVSFRLKGIGHVHQVCPFQGTVPVWRWEGHQLWWERSTMTLHQVYQWRVRCRKVTCTETKVWM